MAGRVGIENARVVDRVRLLNTSNAGLNDFAAESVRIELYDREHKLVTDKEETFGKVFDRAFKQAFLSAVAQRVLRQLFGCAPTRTLRAVWRWLERDTLRQCEGGRVRTRRHHPILGIGGGLNEIQSIAPSNRTQSLRMSWSHARCIL